MKKVVLSLAVMAMISFVSCKETAKEEGTEAQTEVEAPAAEEVVTEEPAAEVANDTAPAAEEVHTEEAHAEEAAH
ncbi:hypothetical protein [Flavobacterium sp. C4GT6]|uniref:hypothetical protein n=1 Tax=Flavobacterium sp. C4GT6 TaxID=3103818 RepID=UPI002ED20D8B